MQSLLVCLLPKIDIIFVDTVPVIIQFDFDIPNVYNIVTSLVHRQLECYSVL